MMNILKTMPFLFLMVTVVSAQNHRIDWSVIASGGGHSESVGHQLDGTVGQAVVGQSSSDSYILKAGYWVGFVARGDCIYFPGDVNHNGTALELSDVVTMIGNYRGSSLPSYVCDCGVDPPGSEFAATTDPNGNCISLELSDVVTEIGAYRGSGTASGCIDCPGSMRLLPDSDNPLMLMPRMKAKSRVSEKLSSE
jgi:hypothetical protein